MGAATAADYPRDARLSGARAFAHVFRRGRRFRSRYFAFVVRRNDAGTARLGFAISRRRVASAVARNRLKRVVRESFRHARSSLPDVDIVVMAETAAPGCDAETLRDSLDRSWDNVRRHGAQRRRKKGSD